MALVAFRPLLNASLRGFATIELPIGLVIRDCPVHLRQGAWAALRAKPQVDRDGRTIRDERGKLAYTAVLDWDSKTLREAFSERVVELVRERHPDAFGDATA
jgi:hypothetical protein